MLPRLPRACLPACARVRALRFLALQFYEHDLRKRMMSQAFNTKPYNDFDNASYIVHFHGPKPHEFVKFLETGKCDFYQVCEQGFLK